MYKHMLHGTCLLLFAGAFGEVSRALAFEVGFRLQKGAGFRIYGLGFT